MIKKLTLTLVICLFAFNAYAQTPMESIKGPTSSIISILKKQEYKNLTPQLREKQWNEIWGVVKSSFDFDIISRLAIGKYWKTFREPQKKEFKTLFAELLANTYINKVQENFKNQKLTYISEKIAGKKAEVLVHVALEDQPVPIIYRMISKNGWLVYDVKIEGMSMIKNYRSQFDEFLFKNSPQVLIERMNRKIKRLREERKKPIN